ncbi:MAG TPA: 50S ribosomal protein L6 [Candidatus Binatia bacterium]|nr:50S ribosomal protein L6 [Candidatus Binatia bacterium]
MSRIGRLPIAIPSGIKVILEDRAVRVEGPKGKLSAAIPSGVQVKMEGNLLRINREADDREIRALHGLTRKLVANMVEGVSRGFSRVLEINGVGYRAEVKGSELHLTLGFSHPVVFPLPPGVTATVERQVVVTLQGADKQLLGKTAAMLRALRPPEPYKGKGIKYREEVIKRKAGKAVGAAGSA